MAKLAEKNILDYRQGGDTVDDFAQKYMAEMTRIYQFLNNIRTHNLDGTEQVEPEAYQLKAEDNKLYIRDAENSKWLYLFDVKYRMGMSDNVEATILTTDDVTSTTEALKLVKTNADGKVEVDTLGNANTATTLQTGREITITDSSGANKGVSVVFNGSKNIEIAMPSAIGGDFTGTFNGSGNVTGTFSGDSSGTFNGTGSLEGTFKGEATGTFSGDLTGTFKGTASEYVPVTDIAKGTLGDIITTNDKLVKIDEDGLLPVDIRGNAGKLAGTRVAITNPEDGQVLAYRAASKTWNNENRAVVGDGKALSLYDGEELVVEYAGSKEVSLDLETTAIKESINKNTTDIATLKTNISSVTDGTTPVAKATQADTASACTGNSATATKLQTARTISLTGAVTGSASFDGSKNISISVSDVADIINTLQTIGWSHNCLYRGKDLTSYFNSGEMSTAIASGKFTDIYPGDYITKSVTIDGTTYSNVKWLVADIDYFMNRGDTATTAHHVVMISENNIGTSYMNSTNTTVGGYQGSYMWKTTIPKYATGIINAFGSSHVLTHRERLTVAIDANSYSAAGGLGNGATVYGANEWVDVKVNIPNQAMTFGHAPFASSGRDVYDCAKQLAVSRFGQEFTRSGWCWLRDVACASHFANVNGNGDADCNYASDVYGVRPYFLLR